MSHELVIAFDGDGRPMQRGNRPLRVGEGDQRVERAELRAGGSRRFEKLRAGS